MNKVAVMSTGGTIASRYNPETQRLSSGVLSGTSLVEAIPDLPEDLALEIRDFSNIPSSFMTPPRMLELSRAVAGLLEREDVRGVVVTHGTDTLEETSYFLDLTLHSDKPVVFTGAQRGPTELASDSIRNLRDAVRVAWEPGSRGRGVLVVANEEIHAAFEVTKTDAYKLESFRSPSAGPIGLVDHAHVCYRMQPPRPESLPVASADARVAVLKVVAGMDGTLVDAARSAGVQGIVVEGFGRGHVPPAMMDAIRRAVAADVLVLVTSRCGAGFVRDVYDFDGGGRDLLRAGALLWPGVPGTKARIRLIAALGCTDDRGETVRFLGLGGFPVSQGT